MSNNDRDQPVTQSEVSGGAPGEPLLVRFGKRWRWWPNPLSRQTGHHDWAAPPVADWHWADSPEEARAACEALSPAGRAPGWGHGGKARPRDRKGRIVAVAARRIDRGSGDVPVPSGFRGCS
jgi:hypothetical protein